jgi:hypothetical protein
VSNDTADSGAAYRSDRAAARQDSPANRTNSGADGSVLILPRHPGASTQAEHHGSGYRPDCISLDHRFHGLTSLEKRTTGVPNFIFRT